MASTKISLTQFSISAHPDLEFFIIINPNSGPGDAPWWPNEDYVREIPRLNACPNVVTLGYVRATYCKRPLEDVFEDIDTYAVRAEDVAFPGLGLQGVFVDETVNLYSEDAKKYLDQVDQKVKKSQGIAGRKLVSILGYLSVNSVC